MIKTQDYKENDKLVWFFTENYGKITAIAKGAKKSKSRFVTNTLPFCYGEYLFFKGKSLHNLSEGNVIDSFQNLLRDLDNITYASYFNELIDICMSEGENNEEVFKLLVTAFYLMKNNAVDLDTLARAFEVKMLYHTGYGLNLEICCHCGAKLTMSNYISFQYSGAVCKTCDKNSGSKISFETFNILKFLSKMPMEKVHMLSISKESSAELKKVLSVFISSNYSRKPLSLQIFDDIKGV